MVANWEDPKLPDSIKEAAQGFIDTWSMDVKRRVGGSRGKKKDGTKEKWSIEELLTAPKHPIISWWLEMNDLAKTRGTYRFLVANKATYHSYVVLGEREVAYIKGCLTDSIVLPDDFDWPKKLGPYLTIVGVSPRVPETLTIFELRSFLKYVNASLLGGLGDGSQEEGPGA
jgi:hypothetical protein